MLLALFLHINLSQGNYYSDGEDNDEKGDESPISSVGLLSLRVTHRVQVNHRDSTALDGGRYLGRPTRINLSRQPW
jgi:hypothetical protein